MAFPRTYQNTTLLPDGTVLVTGGGTTTNAVGLSDAVLSQRFLPLSFSAGSGSLTVTAPANADLAPPGNYMLFLVDTNGVPSTAASVHFGPFFPPGTNPPGTNPNSPNSDQGPSFVSYSGDFNKDGKQDILWRNMQTGEVRIWYMNGSTILSDDGIATVGLEWQIVGIGDFDGDGFSDILWENTVDGSFSIWTMHGDSFVAHQFPSPGPQWSITSVADIDHNGLADIFWRNIVTGEVRVWLSVSPFQFLQRIPRDGQSGLEPGRDR